MTSPLAANHDAEASGKRTVDLGPPAVDDPEEVAQFTRWQQPAEGSRLGVSQFRIAGMYCVACAGTIEVALRACAGVVDARVNASSARAEVTWSADRTQPSALIDAVRRAGYDAAPDLAAPARLLRQRSSRLAWWRLFIAGFCMMQVMMYATPIYLAAPGEMPDDQLRLLQWAGWLLTLPVLLFSAGPLFRGAWNSLRQRRITMDVPVVCGLVIASVASSGATFDPGGIFGDEVWFDSVTMFVFLLLGARSLELAARHRTAATLEAALSTLPDHVERLFEGEGAGSERVAVRRLRPGDRVRVALGQAFPADGYLIEGRTRADESLLSGESAPIAKSANDPVTAGSVNLQSPVVMVVEQVGEETRQAAIVALMRQAATERPPSVRSVDRLAAPFLWMVLLLAAGAAVAWSFIDPSRVVWVAVSVLIVTCPCALSLATPSALLAAGGAFARLGLLPRSLGFIESLAQIDTIVFDKTGTLTDDSLSVRRTTRLAAPPELDDAAVQRMAAGLATWSTHPASRAIARLDAGAADAAAAWFDIEEKPGEGLQARDRAGQWFRLGRQQWLGGDESNAGSGAVCFGAVGQPWVAFELAETLRSDAVTAVQRLQAMGLHLTIASGDHPAKVAALAARLGITDAVGGLRPEQKLALLESRQASGHHALMIGDGLNDAPVLAKADVSIALGHGSHLSQLHADAVLLSARLTAIADARLLALRARRVIRQNMAWAVVYNLVCIPLALAGWLPPWAAGAGMAASSLVVVVNALRAGRLPAGRGESVTADRMPTAASERPIAAPLASVASAG